MTGQAYKRCSRCDEEKPLDEFNLNKGKPDGRRSECRSCQATWRRAHYEANREIREIEAGDSKGGGKR
jgi:hypothetical protein